MELFSLWTKAVFINLALALYSESSFTKYSTQRMEKLSSLFCLKVDNIAKNQNASDGSYIDCKPYAKYTDTCTQEYYPICATNGKTYCNKCIFCLSLRKSDTTFFFAHYGKC